MSQKINHSVFYLELPAADLPAVRSFFERAFDWSFEDYGPEYIAFEDGQLAGGFYKTDAVPPSGGVLVVLWADDLAASQAAVETAGGRISRAAFAYPGGRRFHFLDPAGNEWAACSEA